jgi:hypothetical protein
LCAGHASDDRAGVDEESFADALCEIGNALRQS